MLAVWDQRYQPVANNLALSALVAALPVIVLLGLLGLLRVRAHYAALAGLATALLVALLVYGMPVPTATAALINGALFGLFPIGWIVLTAMFVYDLTVKTGQFELVKDSIAGMASDRRIQVLLIAFSFGAFLEGSAGFGTPVAICASFPTAGQVAIKDRINAITLAPTYDFRRDSDLFGEGVRTAETQRLIETAMKLGLQTRDAEMELASMLLTWTAADLVRRACDPVAKQHSFPIRL